MANNESTREFSDRREKKLGKKYGARQTCNSGAKWFSKGDLKTETHLIEVKSTEKKQMTVKKEWLYKIRTEAIKSGKDPVMIIDFGDIVITGLVELQ